jgi:hypothetical protein
MGQTLRCDDDDDDDDDDDGGDDSVSTLCVAASAVMPCDSWRRWSGYTTLALSNRREKS